MNSPFRRARPSRVLFVALAATVAVGILGLGATPAFAGNSSLQPATTAQDHPITDVAGLVNGRELGSFTGTGGQIVNAPRLIRSESLDKVTTQGAQTLASEYHVDLVIDLRTASQVAAKPDVTIPGAQYLTISMFGDDGNYSDDTVMYHDLVDKGYSSPSSPGVMISSYARILQLLATHTTGTVLIHCSHGMDRTGTVLDLVYRILGVSSTDILHDYLLSNTQLGVTWATPGLLQGTFEGDIATKYSGLDSYIANTVGVTTQEADALRARFLVSNDATASSIRIGGVDVPLAAAATAGGAAVTVPLGTISASDVQVSTASAAASSTVAISGQTVAVTVTAQDGTTVQHYIAQIAAPALEIPQGTTLTAGSAIHLQASGFTPGAVYEIVMHSTPTVIGRVTAAGDGSITTDVTIPASLEAGSHLLFLADANGNPVSAEQSVTVTAAALAGPSVATGGSLVSEPTPWPWLAVGGLGVVMLAAVIVLRAVRLRRGDK